MKIIRILTWTSLTIIFLSTVGYFLYTYTMRNPFDEVKWIKDFPGANDRYVEYTPVLKSDNDVIIGPTVGADFGTLRFKDINGDGTKEAIIETEILIDWGEYRFPQRHVLELKNTPTGQPQFELINSENYPKEVPYGKKEMR